MLFQSVFSIHSQFESLQREKAVMGHQWTFHVIDFNRICHSLQVVEEKVLGNLLTVHKHVGGTCAPAHWPDWDFLATALQSDPLPAQGHFFNLPFHGHSICTVIWRLLLCPLSFILPSVSFTTALFHVQFPLLCYCRTQTDF